MITVREQVTYILLFMVFGMFLSIMYDILHHYLNKIRINLVIGYIIEFIYWLGLAYIACSYMMKVSNGYLTIYTFGFFLLGALIHIYFFSRKFSSDIARFDRWMSKLYQKVKKIIIIIVFPKEVIWVMKKLLPKKKHFQSIIRLFKKKKKKEETAEET